VSLVPAPRQVRQLAARPGGLEWEARAERDPKPHEVRIQVAFAGICGSDLHALIVPEEYGESEVLGHEFSGVVAELGTAVTGIQVGQEVACQPRVPCMRCEACRSGRVPFCAAMIRPEVGAWAETILVHERAVVVLPDGVTLREAALAEPLGCCLRGVEKAPHLSGQSSLVIGGGPIGFMTALAARRLGTGLVVVVEPGAYRRRLLESVGLPTIDPYEASLVPSALDMTDGRGFDVVYEAVGSPNTVEHAVEAAAHGATVVILGVAAASSEASLRPREIFERELAIVGSFGADFTFVRALQAVSELGAERVVTHEFPLSRGSDAVALARTGDCGKILLVPGAASTAVSGGGRD
jgi:2-desacetyl-2-hydroxyethyl bacteriochlorophyllide A dehydrogenase